VVEKQASKLHKQNDLDNEAELQWLFQHIL